MQRGLTASSGRFRCAPPPLKPCAKHPVSGNAIGGNGSGFAVAATSKPSLGSSFSPTSGSESIQDFSVARSQWQQRPKCRRTGELPRSSTPRPMPPLALSDTAGRCIHVTGHWPRILAERQLSITTNAYSRPTAVISTTKEQTLPLPAHSGGPGADIGSQSMAFTRNLLAKSR